MTRVYPKGRRCEHEGCATILSIYNQGTVCQLHEPVMEFVAAKVRSGPRRKVREHEEHRCAECGELFQAKTRRAIYCSDRCRKLWNGGGYCQVCGVRTSWGPKGGSKYCAEHMGMTDWQRRLANSGLPRMVTHA